MLKKDILIYEICSIKEALKKLDKTAEKVLLVVDNEKRQLGTITDGDIRRFVLRGGNFDNEIKGAYNREPIFLRKNNFSLDEAKSMFLKKRIDLIPILDEEDKVSDFISWSQAFSENGSARSQKSEISVPVVIMAGGKATRLEPFTKILPKPLFPIGDKPVVEVIIDEFRSHGVCDFKLVLNYKADMIESYFNSIEKKYKLEYVREKDFQGTTGGLKLLEKDIADTFIVSNCDVIVKANFQDVLNFHREHNSSLTVLSSFQHYRIPYGVVTFEEGGKVTDILEKPEYTFTVNAGVYILSKEVLSFVPRDTYFDMTDLIKVLLEKGKNVFTYPVNENDYVDIGQWGEYKKALAKLKEI